MSDVVVVGGGVAGAAAAFSLARRGAAVTVVDAHHDGAATSAGAGIVEPWSSAASGAFGDLYRAGGEHYSVLLEQLAEVGVSAADIDYRVTGMLILAPARSELDEVAARAARSEGGRAGSLSRLDPGEPASLCPVLDPGLAGLLVSGGGRVDGRRLRDGLVAAAERYGAVVQPGAAVLSVAGGAVTGVTVDGVPIQADSTVVAAGAWSRELLQPLGIGLPVDPQRGQLLHLALPGVDTSEWPCLHAADGSVYLTAFDDRVVVGATRESGSGFDPRPTAAGVHQVLAATLRLAPGLADATLLGTRVGLRPLGNGDQVLIGWADQLLPTDLQGLMLCTGFGAGGLTIAPLAGERVAELVVG